MEGYVLKCGSLSGHHSPPARPPGPCPVKTIRQQEKPTSKCLRDQECLFPRCIFRLRSLLHDIWGAILYTLLWESHCVWRTLFVCFHIFLSRHAYCSRACRFRIIQHVVYPDSKAHGILSSQMTLSAPQQDKLLKILPFAWLCQARISSPCICV